ncbi:type I polyketide synthase [Nostoc sp. UHCC 0702]|nr:type I polyketide synthase [Nostoc sp. UHCC 0702]
MSNIPGKTEQLPDAKRLLLAIKEAKAKLEAVEQDKTEPIAITGLSCRFPGSANNPQAFWQLLQNGVDAVTQVPPERWDIDTYYDSDPDAPGKMYARYGGFLENIDQFDPQFFNISPREAVSLDPQQRLLLEVSWEALENAGQIPERLAGSLTGVFVGITTNDYVRCLIQSGEANPIDAYYSTGNALNAAAGRLSYTLGLMGPSMAVDTACSSSLVAVHLACQSLRNHECRQALAAGVNLILAPENTIALSKARMMSVQGRCKTFDASADGIVRGEGCGVIVLKRLSHAIADGDHILALIRGSAVNQDGPSSGLTVPNKAAQQTLLKQALTAAKIAPTEVNYIEAHGTGTSLGDPIEVRALAGVFAEGRSPENPLRIGSLKTNIGHLESAAGIASLIKVVLSLQHQKIPPHLHLQQPSPYINWDTIPIVVNTELTPWQPGEKRRIAGVSSFGASGTNAHVVLEEAPAIAIDTTAKSLSERSLHILALSAKTPTALKQLAQQYQQHISTHPEQNLADICFSANCGRGDFGHRLSCVVSSRDELLEKLANNAGVWTGEHEGSTQPKIAYLMTGQGSQYVGMAKELYHSQPTFKQALDKCDQILSQYLDTSILDIIYPKTETSDKLEQTAYTQPALFAIEYALCQLWQSWGIAPSTVMGHSVGEYVAACIAGIFSLEDGLKLIAARGRLMQALPHNGAMAAVMADAGLVKQLISPEIAIAAINAPQNTVISGTKTAVNELCGKLHNQGIKTTALAVSHAFHSPLMQPMLAEFAHIAQQISYHPPQINIISNITGELVRDEMTTAEYWCRHILQPVQFAAGVRTLQQLNCQIWLEVGPKPVLLGMARQCLDNTEVDIVAWLPSLRPGQSDWQQILASLAQMYVAGVTVNWSGFDQDYERRRLLLPTYPFQRQRFWAETTTNQIYVKPARHGAQNKPLHPLLGSKLPSALKAIQFESEIHPDSPLFLKDHCVYGNVIVPGTAYIEMALAAGVKVFKSERVTLADITIHQPLILSANTNQKVQLILTAEESSAYSFEIFSLASDEDEIDATWLLHAAGKIILEEQNLDITQVDLATLKPQYTEEIAIADYYQQLSDRGLDYGTNFQGITQLWRQAENVLGEIQLPPGLTTTAANYHLHPVLLDGCFQTLGAIPQGDNQEDIYLPVGVERLRVHRRAGNHLWCHSQNLRLKAENQKVLVADLTLFDDSGAVIAEVEGLAIRQASRKALLRSLQQDVSQWLYQIAWQAQPLDTSALVSREQPGSWLIFSDRQIGTQLATQLNQQGDRTILVTPGANFQCVDAANYQINPLAPTDFQRLCQEITANLEFPVRGVVHLWSLLENPQMQTLPELSCGSTLHLVQALARAGWSQARLLLITQGAQSVGTISPLQVQQSALWGMGRVIALEHPDLQCICLDLDVREDNNVIASLVTELSAPDKENQIAYRQGLRYVPRLVRQQAIAAATSAPYQLRLTDYGILENLTLVPMTRQQPGANEVEIAVRATGLNFRDVLNALGMLQEYIEQLGIKSAADLPFGGECAGIVVAVGENVTEFQVGDQVIAAQAIGSFSSYVIVPTDFVAKIPAGLSFEQAATIPTTFLTAHYGLHHLAQIKPGDRVLIHAAAGGVGQAAIQIAQRAGAEIFATASPGKWDFLKAMGVVHIMNSRTLDFAGQIMAATSGEGVDIVLNSLNGDFIEQSFRVLKAGGKFIEIGKIGIWDQNQAQAKRPDVSYFPFDLLDISVNEPSKIKTLLTELMSDFADGTLGALPHKVFPIQDVASAFRYMAQAKHIGKVVVSLPAITSDAETTTPQPIRADSSYLITGGLGALGLQVAQWLVEQGAKHLVLTGRRGATEETRQIITQLEQQGTEVLILPADISQFADVSQILAKIQATMPPLRGIIHAAGVLDDGVILQQTWERLARVMGAKIAGAWHLHTLTQDLPLDFFVCFSSVSALLGSPGQSNYAAANAFMDALAHHRRALGLPGVSINWGPWAEAGMAAQLDKRDHTRWAAQGISPIASPKGLQILAEVLGQSIAQVAVLAVDWAKFLGQFPAETALPFLEVFTPATDTSSAQQSEFRQQLANTPPEAQKAFLVAYVRSHIGKVLGLSHGDQIGLHQGFADLGMDSLMAIEMKNRLQSSLGCKMPTTLAFDYPTVDALVNYLATEVLGIVETTPTSEQSTTDQETEEFSQALEELSQNEIADLLAQELATIEENKGK